MDSVKEGFTFDLTQTPIVYWKRGQPNDPIKHRGFWMILIFRKGRNKFLLDLFKPRKAELHYIFLFPTWSDDFNSKDSLKIVKLLKKCKGSGATPKKL